MIFCLIGFSFILDSVFDLEGILKYTNKPIARIERIPTPIIYVSFDRHLTVSLGSTLDGDLIVLISLGSTLDWELIGSCFWFFCKSSLFLRFHSTSL